MSSFDFTIDCPDSPTSISVTYFDSTTKSIDLGLDPSAIIKVPTVETLPAICTFTISWVFKRAEDNVDMVASMPQVFKF